VGGGTPAAFKIGGSPTTSNGGVCRINDAEAHSQNRGFPQETEAHRHGPESEEKYLGRDTLNETENPNNQTNKRANDVRQ